MSNDGNENGWRRIGLLPALLAMALLAACATNRAALEPAPVHLAEIEQLPLGPGDLVKVTVYGEETLTDEYMLDKNGVLSMPLIGEVGAAGLAPSELKLVIADRLRAGDFLTNPHVTVAVESRPIYVIGEVNTPGSYPYQPTLDAFSAIALAGGYTPRAARNDIVISRGRPGQKKRFAATEDTALLPGDSILIQQRFF